MSADMDERHVRVRSLADLAVMMGSETTPEESATMRDTLVAAGFLTWEHDSTGGMLAPIGDDEWHAALAASVVGSETAGMWIWHAATGTVIDGDRVELLPKNEWSVCECDTPYMTGHANRCAFCERGI